MRSENDNKTAIGKIEKVIGSYHQELRRITQSRKENAAMLVGVGVVAEQVAVNKLRREAIAEIEQILDMPAPADVHHDA
jgi:hypothetical protein